MAKITNAMLVSANLALETKVTAFEARLAVATAVYRNQRVRIAEFEARFNTPGKPAVHAVGSVPVITYWLRGDGQRMQKTRINNVSSSRPVADMAAA